MMHAPTGDELLDIPAFRARIRKMSDEHLERSGQAAAYMASPAAFVWAGALDLHSAT